MSPDFFTRLARKVARETPTLRGSDDFPVAIRGPYTALEKRLEALTVRPLRVLDFACGYGLHSFYPASLGARVVGVDRNPESLQVARQRAVQLGLQDRTEFLQEDCRALSLPPDSFDVALVSGSLYYLDLEVALGQLQRVLKPGGHLFIIETLPGNPILQLYRRIKKWFGRTDAQTVGHLNSQADLLKGIGTHFHIESVEFYNLLTLAPVNYPPLVALLEATDQRLFRYPLIASWAFKLAVCARKL